MIEYLRSIYMDGLPKIDSWAKSRSASPGSTAAKTGGATEASTPQTKIFEHDEGKTNAKEEAKRPEIICDDAVPKEEFELLVTKNISLEETISLLKDRLIQYERVLVGLDKLAKKIRVITAGGLPDSYTSRSSHHSINFHLEDTDSVNYAKFWELLEFFQEQEDYKQILAKQCSSLDQELRNLQTKLEADGKQSKDELSQERESFTKVRDDWAKEKDQLSKAKENLEKEILLEKRLRQEDKLEHDERFQEVVGLKRQLQELKETMKEMEHDLERNEALARMAQMPLNVQVPVPKDFGEDSPQKPHEDKENPAFKPTQITKRQDLDQPESKHTVKWEHVRDHLTSQVNIYLDLQNKLKNNTFEVRCYDSENQQPLELNLLLEVEKILEGIEDNLDQEYNKS